MKWMAGLSRLAGKFNDLSVGARWLEKDERLTTSFILCTLHKAGAMQCNSAHIFTG